jgi:uncharacterized protein YheU (UPF0270 family)
MNNKRFGNLELTVPLIDEQFGNSKIGMTPRNLVIGFLLDTSGSMEGQKIQHAKNTIQKFVEVIHAERNGKTIERQPFHAWIYVITFDSDTELVIPFQEVTDETIPNILELLSHINTRGSTNYEKAFQKQREVVQDILATLNENTKATTPAYNNNNGRIIISCGSLRLMERLHKEPITLKNYTQ